MAVPFALAAGVQVKLGIFAALTIWPTVTATPDSFKEPVVGKVVILTLANVLAGVSLGSVKPKSPKPKLTAVSSSVVMVLSVPAGASLTDAMVMVAVEVLETLPTPVPGNGVPVVLISFTS